MIRNDGRCQEGIHRLHTANHHNFHWNVGRSLPQLHSNGYPFFHVLQGLNTRLEECRRRLPDRKYTENENLFLWKRLWESSFGSWSSRNPSSNPWLINLETTKSSTLQWWTISRTWNVEKKEYTLLGSHDLVLQSKSPADPTASANETELNLVSKSNMHEWHRSSQVLIVQARSKSCREVQNLPQARIDRLPQVRQHVGQYQYRPVIPKTVYAHYPNYKECSRAVKQMRIWLSKHEKLSRLTLISCAMSGATKRRGTSPSGLIYAAARHISTAQARATSENFEWLLRCFMIFSENLSSW